MDISVCGELGLLQKGSEAVRRLMGVLEKEGSNEGDVAECQKRVWGRVGGCSPNQRVMGGQRVEAERKWRRWYEDKVRSILDKRLEIKALGGKIQRDKGKWAVLATSHFPTIHLTSPSIGLKQPTTSGRWYYEVTLQSDGLMQIGWTGGTFQCDPLRGQGVGDHVRSWAFDGLRRKKWNVTSEGYGRRWRVGDVVGALLDVGRKEMRFYINGEDLGLAFSNLELIDKGESGESCGLRPAASLNTGQKAIFNFGNAPFKYPPGGELGAVRGVGEGILGRRGGSGVGGSLIYDASNTAVGGEGGGGKNNNNKDEAGADVEVEGENNGENNSKSEGESNNNIGLIVVPPFLLSSSPPIDAAVMVNSVFMSSIDIDIEVLGRSYDSGDGEGGGDGGGEEWVGGEGEGDGEGEGEGAGEGLEDEGEDGMGRGEDYDARCAA